VRLVLETRGALLLSNLGMAPWLGDGKGELQGEV